MWRHLKASEGKTEHQSSGRQWRVTSRSITLRTKSCPCRPRGDPRNTCWRKTCTLSGKMLPDPDEEEVSELMLTTERVVAAWRNVGSLGLSRKESGIDEWYLSILSTSEQEHPRDFLSWAQFQNHIKVCIFCLFYAIIPNLMSPTRPSPFLWINPMHTGSMKQSTYFEITSLIKRSL